ncbi:MAG: preprotein translocase subunit SecA [Candidatus Kerfeldbacteria bacterium]|nr:preprotein translocase subunit SecA [Candidatus Kerfeldbacteria bacterium]
MALLTKLFGDPSAKAIKQLQPVVQRITALEAQFQSLSDDELKAKTVEFKQRLSQHETLEQLLPEAFATVREASRRVLGQRHYDVQLLGGMVLHHGKIAEMKTGEGKTLTATLPVYLNALTGRGVHVVTVNDYLARRDVDWMGRLYHWLNLSVGCIQNQGVSYLFDPDYQKRADTTDQSTVTDTELAFKVDMDNLRAVDRTTAYQADITYGTNNEFGFDYLRDNMVQTIDQRVQRGWLSYAIVDEVDSILIDEARTPLIISGQAEAATKQYYRFSQLVEQLVENDDYNIDEKMRVATLTDGGIAKMEQWLDVVNIYEAGGVTLVHHIEQALKAQTLFKRDRDYVVKDGEVIIVDEFTGRLMPGRRYSEGLHQAIEAKERLEIKRESRTLATITFQNLFRLYEKLAGMTGTAETEKEEFYKIYKLDVVVIPTNQPMVRRDGSDAIYRTERGKFKAVVNKVSELHQQGVPVLVGTISIEKNEILSQLLNQAGVPHQVLNAKQHEREAEIIAQAGQSGAVTIATNMAGRGVDIILGGNPPDTVQAEIVRSVGGLFVLGTERHEARRIDNQLRGRSGRQGDPGKTQFFVSMEDDLMRIFATDRIKKIMGTLNWPEDMPIENAIVSRSIETAQKKVEGHNFDIREHLVKYDDVMNKHREVIYRKRNEILKSPPEDISTLIMELVENEIEQIVSFHTNLENEHQWNIQEIYESIRSIFPVDEQVLADIKAKQQQAGNKLQDAQARTSLVEYLVRLATNRYQAMVAEVDNAEVVYKIEQGFYLRAIDTLWIEHLDQMSYLREGISLRGYGQRDPLVEYKKEAYSMFSELIANIQKQVVYSIFKMADAYSLAPSEMKQVKQELHGAKKTMGNDQADSPNDLAKVGRNDPCPCGSGKKYKKCHLIGN